MKATSVSVRIFVMSVASILPILCHLGFPDFLLLTSVVLLYCYGTYVLYVERKAVGELLTLLLWFVIPCAEPEKEGEDSPYPAGQENPNPLEFLVKNERRIAKCLNKDTVMNLARQ